jgi:ribosomal protein L11 methylase PrmA
MGTGSGILAETAIISGIPIQNILAADTDSECIKNAKKKKINAVKSNSQTLMRTDT